MAGPLGETALLNIWKSSDGRAKRDDRTNSPNSFAPLPLHPWAPPSAVAPVAISAAAAFPPGPRQNGLHPFSEKPARAPSRAHHPSPGERRARRDPRQARSRKESRLEIRRARRTAAGKRKRQISDGHAFAGLFGRQAAPPVLPNPAEELELAVSPIGDVSANADGRRGSGKTADYEFRRMVEGHVLRQRLRIVAGTCRRPASKSFHVRLRARAFRPRSFSTPRRRPSRRAITMPNRSRRLYGADKRICAHQKNLAWESKYRRAVERHEKRTPTEKVGNWVAVKGKKLSDWFPRRFQTFISQS